MVYEKCWVPGLAHSWKGVGKGTIRNSGTHVRHTTRNWNCHAMDKMT